MLRRGSSHALATLIGVKSVVKRPYKVNIEVRLTSSGFAVTIVARGTRALSAISKALRENGYKYAVYIDSYGFVRLHVRGLTLDEVAFIEKIVHENISKKTSRDELALVSS